MRSPGLFSSELKISCSNERCSATQKMYYSTTCRGDEIGWRAAADSSIFKPALIFTDQVHLRLESSLPFGQSSFYLSGILASFFTQSHIMSTHRKSVAFSDEHTVVASNGEVTEVNGIGEPDKTSAESHSIGEFESGPQIPTAC